MEVSPIYAVCELQAAVCFALARVGAGTAAATAVLEALQALQPRAWAVAPVAPGAWTGVPWQAQAQQQGQWPAGAAAAPTAPAAPQAAEAPAAADADAEVKLSINFDALYAQQKQAQAEQAASAAPAN